MSFFTVVAVVVGTLVFIAFVRRRRRRNAKEKGTSVAKIIQWFFYIIKRRKQLRKLVEEEKNNPIFRPTTRMVGASGFGEYFGRTDKFRLPPGAKARDVEDLQTKLKLRCDDVVITAFPKSGTTWTQQIVKLVRNRGVEDGKDLEVVSPWVDMMTLEEVEAMESPRGFKTHMPFQYKIGGDLEISPAKYIYTYRNPKDTAVSFYHFSKGYFPMMDWETFFDRYLKGAVMYGKGLDHIMSWWEHRDAPNLLIVCYEEMHKDPQKQIRRIAEFLNVDLTPEIIDSIAEQTLFKNMKKNPAANMYWTDRYRDDDHGKFMRKGKVGDWRNHFTEEQSAKIDAWIAARIPTDCGLVFDFGEE